MDFDLLSLLGREVKKVLPSKLGDSNGLYMHAVDTKNCVNVDFGMYMNRQK